MECKICGEENCKVHTFFLSKPVKVDSFSGSSPPEVFIGKWNYPNVYIGVLSPPTYGDTQEMSSPEIWHSRKLPINNILNLRKELIYGRQTSNVKKVIQKSRFLSTLQELSMTHKSTSTLFNLKSPIAINKEKESRVPLISRAASANSIKLEENTKILPKVDYLVNDIDVKSSIALQELEKSKIETSSMIKILSSGLLGQKTKRRLVPTRWAITAVDSTLSQQKISLIKYFPIIEEFQVFTAEYLGNHYEFLLLPSTWEFEVIELSLKTFQTWHDHESFFKRKTYADSVTGAYYANRLALSEHLIKKRRQASCIVFREVRPEYYAPLGVGILRQTSRDAFSSSPKTFTNINEALNDIQTRLKASINNYTEKSITLKNFGKQTRLNSFF